MFLFSYNTGTVFVSVSSIRQYSLSMSFFKVFDVLILVKVKQLLGVKHSYTSKNYYDYYKELGVFTYLVKILIRNCHQGQVNSLINIKFQAEGELGLTGGQWET